MHLCIVPSLQLPAATFTDLLICLHQVTLTCVCVPCPDFDDSMSGTTAITVLVRGRDLIVANVGDSRAVLAERRGDKVLAQDLSIDQTPYR